MQSVRRWLEQLELPQYAEAFERNAIDLNIARDLTQQDLQDLGVQALGHRKVLLRAIAELSGTHATTAGPPAAQDQAPIQRPLGVSPVPERTRRDALSDNVTRLHSGSKDGERVRSWQGWV